MHLVSNPTSPYTWPECWHVEHKVAIMAVRQAADALYAADAEDSVCWSLCPHTLTLQGCGPSDSFTCVQSQLRLDYRLFG